MQTGAIRFGAIVVGSGGGSNMMHGEGIMAVIHLSKRILVDLGLQVYILMKVLLSLDSQWFIVNTTWW